MGEASRQQDSADVLIATVGRKRQQVAAACQQCRRRRIKCNAERPCDECHRRHIECVYVTRGNETVQQARKRRYDELSQSQEPLHRLYEILAGADEDTAAALYQRIRSGVPVEGIATQTKREPSPISRGHLNHFLSTSHERLLRQKFVVALVQSTAGLDQISRFAATALKTARLNFPPNAFEALAYRTVTLDTLASLLLINDPDSSHASQQHPLLEDGTYRGPLHWAPVSTWTELVKEEDDEAASHLVSLYLNLINPYWRFVDEDSFLRAIRGRVPSPYCSAFLVNALLACASLFSEVGIAFSTPGDLLTRGEHFHNEAIRLWRLEEGQTSLVNIEAMLLLSMSSSFRGKDRLGYSFLKFASQMDKRLPIPEPGEDKFDRDAGYMRVRRIISCSALWMDVTYTAGIMHNHDELISTRHDPTDLADVLPESTVYWVGFTLQSKPVPIDTNILIRYRCGLTRLHEKLLIMTSSRPQNKHETFAATEDLATEMRKWYRSLPDKLIYRPDMPTGLFELYGHYYWMLMNLYKFSLETFDKTSDAENSTDTEKQEGYYATLRRSALDSALSGASLIRHYRETYGLRTVSPSLIHTAAHALNIFLANLISGKPIIGPASSAQASQDGFTECFRLLVAMGLGLMLPRGIARMFYHTSRILEVELPAEVIQMLSLVSELAWQPSDIHQLNSCYPNWALASAKNAEVVNFHMDDMLRKWEDLGVQGQALTTENEEEASVLKLDVSE